MTARLLKVAALAAVALGVGIWSHKRRYDLAGKNVLVSGGSRGLGLALARELAGRGARLLLLARDVAELERARVDLATRGANDVVLLPCDVTDPEDVDKAIAAAVAACGHVDVLANVVGEIEVGPVDSMRIDDFEKAMKTNFWGPLRLIREVIPRMRSFGGGRIVNVSSIGGLVAVPHLLPYVASKFALTGLSLGLRAELAKDNIVVSTICPGLMRTGSPANAFFKGDRAREFDWFAASDSIPLLTTSAERAARRIARAIERGDAMVVITLPGKAAALAQALDPDLVARAMELANRVLPDGEDAAPATRGRAARPAWLPSWLTRVTDRAEVKNNEASAANGA